MRLRLAKETDMVSLPLAKSSFRIYDGTLNSFSSRNKTRSTFSWADGQDGAPVTEVDVVVG